jgi:hypothetical protein
MVVVTSDLDCPTMARGHAAGGPSMRLPDPVATPAPRSQTTLHSLPGDGRFRASNRVPIRSLESAALAISPAAPARQQRTNTVATNKSYQQ